MAHPQQLQFVRLVSEHLATDYSGRRVLEIGSYDVNGSIRQLFRGGSYVGVDLLAGPGVDLVCDGHRLDHPDDTYDLTLSCESFEHDPQWRETLLNMYRMTKPGGIVLITCATTGRLEHGTDRTSPLNSPGTQSVGWNYYLNLTARDFRRGVAMEQLFAEHFFLTNKDFCDLYFVASKKGGPSIFHFEGQTLKELCSREAAEFKRARDARSRFRILRALILVPLQVASRLPERYFQNFALPYCKFVHWLLASGDVSGRDSQ